MPSINQLVPPSIFGLTCLLFIGLFFFIRASTKDRTETAQYATPLEAVPLLESLQQYFSNRSYRVIEVNQTSGQIALEGAVGASLFLAVFLGTLAGIGLLCLAFVLAIAMPGLGQWPYSLLLLSPLAAWFYWRGATRTEQVTFKILSPDELSVDSEMPAQSATQTQLQVTAHRDELATLTSQLPLKRREAE
ncbi:MAG: cofactor assembly of complex C subunit B [Leptolyngbyaceae cyanobacterium]